KGYNLHVLRHYRRALTIGEEHHVQGEPWEVPDGVVISTSVLQSLIATDAELYTAIGHLDTLSQPYRQAPYAPAHQLAVEAEIAHVASTIQARLAAMALPEELQAQLYDAYDRVGAETIAVRSSSTGEDGLTRAGAGMGTSVFHVAGKTQLLLAVRTVLASLF